ncbi:MAG: DNA-binding transcriptional LysR family regulator [Myxococcota bacterium]|jgi:DNA-binding transcriptional LysR family regulator
MPLPDLDILVAVADAGNLTAAAEQLGLPRPTLSRRLARLEEQLGVRLVHRTTRVVALTDTGQLLYQHARPIVDAIAAASNAVRAEDGVPRGLLRVSVPGVEGGLSDMIVAFAEAFPQVRVEVSASSRHVDLVAEGFDAALRAGQLTGPSLVSRRLNTDCTLAYASPAYLERRGVPATPDALRDHDCLVGFERGEVPRRAWPLLEGGQVPVHARLASNNPQVLVRAAERGLGIALLPKPFIRELVDGGSLVPVLVDAVGARSGMWLVFPERRLMLPRVRAFIDHVVRWLEEHPMESP